MTLLLQVACVLAASLGAREEVYEKDVTFALDELERRCGQFFELKRIDWKAVRADFTKAAAGVKDDTEHLVLLTRLLARLHDGHAEVQPGKAGGELPWPQAWRDASVSPGFFLCRIGKKLYVKSAWSSAAEVGIEPGMEVVSVDGESATRWFEERRAELVDRASFSTEQHALFAALQYGFLAPSGTRLDLEVKELAGKKHKRTITYSNAKAFNEGPAFFPEGAKWVGESVRFARTKKGSGYVQVRRIREKVIEELDQALSSLADADGLVLDFRGNTGGACDHDAFEARFVPLGHTMPRLAREPLAGAGASPYGGPIVVIVDGTVVSAGETTSGMLKEDGRAWMIGESATAGMSSQKETVELPSGKFVLDVSVGTNRSSFNGGRGIEGIGVAPNELVEYVAKDLAAGIDTLTEHAEELLQDFPAEKVAYRPADYGWKR
jgi:hypothetical protein